MEKIDIVNADVARLATISREDLQREYVKAFRLDPGSLSETFMRRRLAQRLQEGAFGGLTQSEKNALSYMVRREGTLTTPTGRRAKAAMPVRGVTYVREYKGAVHEVRAAGYGMYEYAGVLYRSLTAIAGVITGGQHISGRKFFRLKESVA